MSGPKKRKVDSECRVFKREWTTKYFFTKVRSMPVCLICQETLAVFKEYNLSRHFATKHGNYASKQSPQEREATAQRLMAKLQAQQNVFHRQTAIQETTTKASFMLSFKLAKASKPLSEGEFLKECMIETSGLLCPKSKGKFEKLSLSRRTVTRRVELIDEDLASKLNSKAEFFKFYSLALDESNDVKDTAQLLIFIHEISDNFEITEEFLAMEPLKRKTRGEDFYDRVSTVIEKMKLPWSKLANVMTDGSPNLTGKNVGLLKRIQDKVKEENPNQDVIFLHCIIHQESLCKSILQLNHVVNPVVKFVNFIRAKGLQHLQYIKFLEETDANHHDLLYHSHKVFTHFATLATQKETIQNVKKYSKSLDDLHAEFCRQFSDVEKIDQSLQLVACPLSQNPETAPEEVQLELIDLQSDFVLKEKFSSLELRDFYASLNEATFPNIWRMAQKILVLFGSTYVCEQTFSVMNINKAPHRSSLTDEHLRSILRIATTKLTPDFDALAKKGDQQYCSH
uniref:Uncharacterized protein n=1 Tax=Myotis myotis TaxID=51298 RepID=A0A7J7YDY2_MYOMY|nr:hypothetical protein mMyoMyo1_011042 [Myotis myotis]